MYRSTCSFGPSLARQARSLSTKPGRDPVVAVLFQDIDSPVISGVQKPRKPGGYQDSGADIAYALRSKGIHVITPEASPQVSSYQGWCFPDSEEGICSAVKNGATHLWANTILFDSHPLQQYKKLDSYASELFVVGQPPGLVEQCDDKAFLNGKLHELGGYTMPRMWLISKQQSIDFVIESIDRFPVVGKPVRGRGSHGVKVCHSKEELKMHVAALIEESPLVMVEEFLAGEEATLTIMPPSLERPGHWSMLPVTRFNHSSGIAPYNGTVAVTANSRLVSMDEMKDPAYQKIMDECVKVAQLIGATAPIRVDVRRFTEGSEFALFDINMKPNMTGPGRPDAKTKLVSRPSLPRPWVGTMELCFKKLSRQLKASALSVLTAMHFRSILKPKRTGSGCDTYYCWKDLQKRIHNILPN